MHGITAISRGITMSTTVTSKGQVTIPKRMRDAIGIKPGSKIEFEYKPGVGLTLKPLGKPRKSDYRRRLDKVRGTLKTGMSTDELMQMLRGD
jgi:AbrB family looped-hinge helix DNA binding protein